jgi:hypothetical protein
MYYPSGGFFGTCMWNDAATTLTGDLWDNTLNPVTKSCTTS